MKRWPPLKQKIRKRKLEELSKYATTMHNADAERIRREIISASKEDQKRKWKTKLQHLSRACMMDRLEEMMTESNTKVLDSVSQQTRGMNTTIGTF